MPIRITLDNILQRKDMSGRELERRTGVHRDTIGKYRHNAVRIINLDLVEAFCDALGCQLTDLLTDDTLPATEETRTVEERAIYTALGLPAPPHVSAAPTPAPAPGRRAPVRTPRDLTRLSDVEVEQLSDEEFGQWLVLRPIRGRFGYPTQ